MEAREGYREELARQLGELTMERFVVLQQRARTRRFLQHPHIVWLQLLVWEVLGVASTTTH